MRNMTSSNRQVAGCARTESRAQQCSGDCLSEKRAAAPRPAARRDCAAGRRTSRGLPRAIGFNFGMLKRYRGRAPTAALRQPRMFLRMTIATALLPVQVVRARHANRQSQVSPCVRRAPGDGRVPCAARANACVRPLTDIHRGKCCRVPKCGRRRAPTHSSLIFDVPMYGARQAARGSPSCGAVPVRRMTRRTRQFSAMNSSERPHA